MKIAVFDTHSFDRQALEAANREFDFELVFFDVFLKAETAALGAGFPVVCPFVNDHLDRPTLQALRQTGLRLVALRCAGFNNVDLAAARDLDITVVRVPEYSPYAVAEHAVALMLTLNRKIHRAHARVREGNFSLDGLVGFDFPGKTLGLIGTGKIGRVLARIMNGFGCRLIAYDLVHDPELASQVGLTYMPLEELLPQSDIVSLHVPLTPKTRHLLNHGTLSLLKHGVMLINTSRGALIDSRALLNALKSGQIGAAGLDVYEEEEAFFFRDLSGEVIQDDVLARLTTFPNVIITAHQAFLTREALASIARTTLSNVQAFAAGQPLVNQIVAA